MKILRTVLRTALVLGGSLLALVAAAVISLVVLGHFNGRAREDARQFNGDVWRSGAPTSEDPYSPRLRMASAALEQLEPGMSRDEIIAILGLPDREDDRSMTWELGVNLIDWDSLVVFLDENGRMTRAAHIPG